MTEENKNKGAFWKALVFTVIVFGFGLIVGSFFENSRVDSVERSLINSELNLADEQVRNNLIENMNLSCDNIKRSTFDFADRIYAEAVQLEEYDAATKFTGSLKVLHKRYDLLRMMLWSESVNVKKRCGNDFHTVVYLYNYEVDDVNKKALQSSFSRILIDLKNNHPDDILLIPMAVNLNVDSINLAVSPYEFGDYPAIVIDENKTITELVDYEVLEKAVFSK